MAGVGAETEGTGVTEPARPTTRDATGALLLAALASAGAGLVHAAAAGTHSGDVTLVRIFAATAAVQLSWAALAAVRQSRAVAVAGVVLGFAAVAAWVWSRTAGLPFIDSLAAVEPVSLQDAMAAALAAVSTVLALAAAMGLRPPVRGRGPAGAFAAVALLALAVPGVAAEHGHGPSHDHGDEAGTHPHSGDEAEHADAGHAGDAHAGDEHAGDEHGPGEHAGPVVSLTDVRVDDEQRAAAQGLIDDTIAGMARFNTVESVEAAGYISIGDGVTGWEHFIHIGHIMDGRDLDPDAIESVVFKVHEDGTRQLASAMYIMGFGSTMDDVPDIAGELTSWHDHQDLCWNGAQVTGRVDEQGNCARGEFRPTPPMLHVWLLPHPCGPFAGIEGSHGSGCEHDHGDDGEAGKTATPEREREETAAGS